LSRSEATPLNITPTPFPLGVEYVGTTPSAFTISGNPILSLTDGYGLRISTSRSKLTPCSSAFAIGASAAMPAAFVPETAPLANQFEVALGTAILSGNAARVSDLALGGGACG